MNKDNFSKKSLQSLKSLNFEEIIIQNHAFIIK